VQQGSPELPQSVHWGCEPTVEHTEPWLQMFPWQHGRASLPHDSQYPLVVHTWELLMEPHDMPVPTHVRVDDWTSQQSPPLH
jgi:hypothetical protein